MNPWPTSNRVRLVTRFPQVALVGAGAIWAAAGVFSCLLVWPTLDEDGIYWDMIDPISAQRASHLRGESVILLAFALLIMVMHFVAAGVWSKAEWERRAMVTIGVFYVAVAFLTFACVVGR